MQHKSNQIKAGVRETLPFLRVSDCAAWLLYAADHNTMTRRDKNRLLAVVCAPEPTLADYLTVRRIAARVLARPYIGEEASV